MHNTFPTKASSSFHPITEKVEALTNFFASSWKCIFSGEVYLFHFRKTFPTPIDLSWKKKINWKIYLGGLVPHRFFIRDDKLEDLFAMKTEATFIIWQIICFRFHPWKPLLTRELFYSLQNSTSISVREILEKNLLHQLKRETRTTLQNVCVIHCIFVVI